MKWTEPEDVERKHWSRLPEPPEPKWPTIRKCECCGADTFVVTSQDGDSDLVIDAKPMRLTVSHSGAGVAHVMRTDARFEMLKREGGYRLEDPQLFGGVICEDDSPDMIRRGLAAEPTWEWFATRMSLDSAHASSARIYSKHLFTCVNASKRAIESTLSNVAVTGEAAGSMVMKKVRPSKIDLDDNFYGDDAALCDAAFEDMQASDF